MPSDLTGDDVGAPELCAFHHEVVRNLEGKDHVGDEDSARVAAEPSRQCCNRYGRTLP
jgi:hypothetical protein